MKQSPELQSIQEKMQPGSLSAKGFLGDDTRSLADILAGDHTTLERLGISHSTFADRLRYFTAGGISGLGSSVIVDGTFEVTVEEFKGSVPCPFSDHFHAVKRNTRVINLATGRSFYWSELNVHMIEAHGFYEGKGSFFRVDPIEAVEILEIKQNPAIK